jgi:hypothetical protein
MGTAHGKQFKRAGGEHPPAIPGRPLSVTAKPHQRGMVTTVPSATTFRKGVVHRRPGATVRVYRVMKAPEAKDELAAVMASLVTIGWLEPEAPTSLVKPINTWIVKPAVHVLFAERTEREQVGRQKARRCRCQCHGSGSADLIGPSCIGFSTNSTPQSSIELTSLRGGVDHAG